jgi:hypothetical protein
MIYGYARVSTDGQSVAAQVAALLAAGAGKVFREVASGAKTDRVPLRKAIAVLEAGDVLMVTRLDPLARSTRDLLNTLAAITGSKAGLHHYGAWAADAYCARRAGGIRARAKFAHHGESRARAVARSGDGSCLLGGLYSPADGWCVGRLDASSPDGCSSAPGLTHLPPSDRLSCGFRE